MLIAEGKHDLSVGDNGVSILMWLVVTDTYTDRQGSEARTPRSSLFFPTSVLSLT